MADATEYCVYRSVDTPLTSVGSPCTSYTLPTYLWGGNGILTATTFIDGPEQGATSQLYDGLTYYYAVTALNSSGESAPSTVVHATPTITPQTGSGALDPTFGVLLNGQVTATSTAGATTSQDVINAVAEDGNHKIVAVGYSYDAAGKRNGAVWRWNPDGTPDTTFNTTLNTGYCLMFNTGGAPANPADTATSVVIDASNNIIAAGRTQDSGNQARTVVWRLKAGCLDTTFNSTGFVVLPGALEPDAFNRGVERGREWGDAGPVGKHPRDRPHAQSQPGNLLHVRRPHHQRRGV